jgi:hypothetical protein
MPDPLVDATAAFRRAVLGIEEAQARAIRLVTDAKARRDRARADLAAAIVQASMAGRRTRDLVDVTGYSRERIRQILRAAGVESD